ncbi:MAG TPA: ADP-ribosyltransferase, partial [Acidobacteriota bacterium]|nr:ADP-ribosyltransferase [Acidobacteriota bacterium]
DTWAAISGGKVTAQGSGIASLEIHLDHNKAKPAATNTMAASSVSVSHPATSTAKAYGDKIAEEKFKFAESGIANETALPTKVKQSITAYKGSSYQEINHAMRFNDSFDANTVSAQTMAHILNLQRAFSAVAPSQKDAVVGRKIGVEGLKAMAKDAGLGSLDDLKPGMVLREPGIVSTSHSPHVWSGNVRFEIKVPKGSRAIDISETIKTNQGEQEVLLGPDSKLKISEVKKDHTAHGHKYQYHIVCELVQ